MSKVLVGDYIIDTANVLGGHNSKIFEAFHVKTGEAAIAKVVNYSKNHRNTFIREAQVLRNLQYSPGIISLRYCTESRSEGIMILPRMQCDLLDLLQAQKQTRFHESTAKQIFRQILQGVQSCHTLGVAHLDLKPENVFLSETGKVYIGDFGSSCCMTQEELIKGCAGTLIYAPPEVVAGICYDPFLADIWSLGVMCFVLVTGSWPYSDAQAASINARSPFYLTRKELYAKMKPYSLSLELEEFISMMLQCNPDMRADLNELLDHEWLSDTLADESSSKESSEDTSTENLSERKASSSQTTHNLAKRWRKCLKKLLF
jgi:serine/threonine protein kinase